MLFHTDGITFKGGVEELLNPSANPREPDIRNTSAAPKTAWLPTECARPWPDDKRQRLLTLFQAHPSIRRAVSPRPPPYSRALSALRDGSADIGPDPQSYYHILILWPNLPGRISTFVKIFHLIPSRSLFLYSTLLYFIPYF